MPKEIEIETNVVANYLGVRPTEILRLILTATNMETTTMSLCSLADLINSSRYESDLAIEEDAHKAASELIDAGFWKNTENVSDLVATVQSAPAPTGLGRRLTSVLERHAGERDVGYWDACFRSVLLKKAPTGKRIECPLCRDFGAADDLSVCKLCGRAVCRVCTNVIDLVQDRILACVECEKKIPEEWLYSTQKEGSD